MCEPLFSFKERLGPPNGRAFSMAGKCPVGRVTCPSLAWISEVPRFWSSDVSPKLRTTRFLICIPALLSLIWKFTVTCGRPLKEPGLGQGGLSLGGPGRGRVFQLWWVPGPKTVHLSVPVTHVFLVAGTWAPGPSPPPRFALDSSPFCSGLGGNSGLLFHYDVMTGWRGPEGFLGREVC